MTSLIGLVIPQNSGSPEIGYEDLRFPASNLKPGASDDPTFTKISDDGSSSVGVYTYSFPAGAEKYLFFNVQMPHAWREGSSIIPHVHWIPSSTHTGNIKWGLEYMWANIDAAYPATTTIIYAEVAAPGAVKHVMTDFDAIVATGKTFSSMLMCRIFRDASDTFTGAGHLLEIDFHYTAYRLGHDF